MLIPIGADEHIDYREQAFEEVIRQAEKLIERLRTVERLVKWLLRFLKKMEQVTASISEIGKRIVWIIQSKTECSMEVGGSTISKSDPEFSLEPVFVINSDPAVRFS